MTFFLAFTFKYAFKPLGQELADRVWTFRSPIVAHFLTLKLVEYYSTVAIIITPCLCFERLMRLNLVE